MSYFSFRVTHFRRKKKNDKKIQDDDLFKMINNINCKCEICQKNKKPKSKPNPSFTIVKTLIAVALDTKQ